MSVLLKQKPKKPIHHVPQCQVHHPSLPWLSLALQSLNPRLLPMYLPTCIFSVMSCPVPSSRLILAGNKIFPKTLMRLTPKLPVKRQKSLETQIIPFLMSLIVNICHPYHMLHLKWSGLVTTKHLKRRRKRNPGRKSQRGRPQRPSQSRRNQG